METTTLTLKLPKSIRLALENKARSRGTEMIAFAESVLEQEANRPDLDEILKPIRDGFVDSGMTEGDLAELIDSEIKAVRSERSNGRVPR